MDEPARKPYPFDVVRTKLAAPPGKSDQLFTRPIPGGKKVFEPPRKIEIYGSPRQWVFPYPKRRKGPAMLGHPEGL